MIYLQGIIQVQKTLVGVIKAKKDESYEKITNLMKKHKACKLGDLENKIKALYRSVDAFLTDVKGDVKKFASKSKGTLGELETLAADVESIISKSECKNKLIPILKLVTILVDDLKSIRKNFINSIEKERKTALLL